MKNLSLKQKLTILYTVLMTVNICAVLAVLFSLSNREILSSVQNRLRESVTGAFDDIDWEDGRLDLTRISWSWKTACISLCMIWMEHCCTARSLRI